MAKTKTKSDKPKKPNFLVRAGRSLKETFGELKRVTWPTFGKVVKTTAIVVVVVVAFMVAYTAVNVGLGALLSLIGE